MRTGTFLALLALAFTLFATPTLADKGDVVLRFGASFTTPTGDLTDVDVDEVTNIEADSTTGGGVSVEYMATDLIGINTGVGFMKPDIEGTMTDGAGNVLESGNSATPQ